MENKYIDDQPTYIHDRNIYLYHLAVTWFSWGMKASATKKIRCYSIQSSWNQATNFLSNMLFWLREACWALDYSWGGNSIPSSNVSLIHFNIWQQDCPLVTIKDFIQTSNLQSKYKNKHIFFQEALKTQNFKFFCGGSLRKFSTFKFRKHVSFNNSILF